MTQGMSGDGGYDRHSDYQMAGGRSHLDLVSSAAQRVAQSLVSESFVIADYGSAQGRTSGPLITAATGLIREARPEVPIFVCHNDILGNDWKTLFDRLAEEDSYPAMTSMPITPMVSATSFYEPVTPAGVVNLGLSFAAIQWLKEPHLAGSGNALYFDQLGAEMLGVVKARAESDWSRFLSLRGKELAPGGKLVLDMMGVDSKGVAAGNQAWAHLSTIVTEMVENGRISSQAVDEYFFPVYERTMEELVEPLEQDAGPSLRLEYAELIPVPNPIAERYAEDGDWSRFARDTVGFIRAFSEPSLRSGLELTDEAADEMYGRLLDRLGHVPDDFTFDVQALTAVIARDDS